MINLIDRQIVSFPSLYWQHRYNTPGTQLADISIHSGCNQFTSLHRNEIMPSSRGWLRITTLVVLQECLVPPIDISEEAEAEKARRRDDAVRLFYSVDKYLPRNYTAIGFNPESGTPVIGGQRGSLTHNDVRQASDLVNYQIFEGKGESCDRLIHPEWGEHVYPATLFSDAPVQVLQRVFEEAAKKEKWRKHKSRLNFINIPDHPAKLQIDSRILSLEERE